MASCIDLVATAQKVLMQLIEYKSPDAAEVDLLRRSLPTADATFSAHELACAVINKTMDRVNGNRSTSKMTTSELSKAPGCSGGKGVVN